MTEVTGTKSPKSVPDSVAPHFLQENVHNGQISTASSASESGRSDSSHTAFSSSLTDEHELSV